MNYQSLNPFTEELIREFPLPTDKQIEESLEKSKKAFDAWSKLDLEKRKSLILKVADILESRAPEFAKALTLEMGKLIGLAEYEVSKCGNICRYYVQRADELLASREIVIENSKAHVSYEAQGPILGIMPWNWPYSQSFRFAIPNLIAGNTVIVKPAPNVPQCGIDIENIFLEAGLPEGAYTNLFLSNEQAETVISDSRIRGVSFTGSARGGSQVAEIAGRNIKKSILELGGSDPFIVLDEVDLDKAVELGVNSRCGNNGQTCCCAKRFLIHKNIYDDFVYKFVEKMKSKVLGNPFDSSTEVGPLARKDLRDLLHRQVTKSVEMGAKLLCGGTIPERKGFFYEPAVIVDAPLDSPARIEEFFGPVATIIPFSTDEEAIKIANETVFGLGASIHTNNISRAKKLIPLVESGMVYVNRTVGSIPELPFGGVKSSGFGRELSDEGIREFLNIKSVFIKK